MQSRTHEVERKLAVHGPFDLPDLSRIEDVSTVEEASQQRLRATYYDTDDLRLARNGITLRYRSGEDSGPIWTVKLPVDGAVYTRRRSQYRGIRVIGAAQASDLVTAFVRSERLAPVTRIHTRRKRLNLLNGSGEVGTEVVDDEVSVVEGSRVVARFRELEVEDKGAGPEAVEVVAAVLHEAGALSGDSTPKAIRALGARAPRCPTWCLPRGSRPRSPPAVR